MTHYSSLSFSGPSGGTVDAEVSKTSIRKGVPVRMRPRAPPFHEAEAGSETYISKGALYNAGDANPILYLCSAHPARGDGGAGSRPGPRGKGRTAFHSRGPTLPE